MKEKIEFSEFLEIEKKLEIKYGTIIDLKRINKKILKLIVDFGPEDERIVVTNIGDRVNVDQFLVGYQFPFITNLQPAVIWDFESQAMIMIVEDENGNIQWPKEKFLEGSKLF